MMGEKDFADQARAIAETNNIRPELAQFYLALIGDTPELGDDGRAIVRDESGAEIARIELPIDS